MKIERLIRHGRVTARRVAAPVKYGVDLAFGDTITSIAFAAGAIDKVRSTPRRVRFVQPKGDDGVATYVGDSARERRRRHGRRNTKNGWATVRGEAFQVWVHSTHRGGRDETARDVPRGWIRREWKGLDEFVVVKTRPITDSKSSVADQLEKALVSARTWRDTSYVMALFVVATVVIGTWIVIRRDGPYAANARSTNADGFVRIDEFDDLSRGDEAT